MMQQGISGTHTTCGIPHGSTSITPFLVINDATQALKFYEEVFHARIVNQVAMSGVVVHAEVDFGHGRLQLGEPHPAYNLVTAPDGDNDCYSLALYCADVDEVVNRAAQRGAVLREPPTDFISGDRFASIRDPFGVRWTIMTRIEDLSEEESRRRAADWAASQH